MDERAADPLEDHGTHRGVPTGSTMHLVYIFALAAVVMGLYFGMHYEIEDNQPAAGARSVAAPRLHPVPAGVIPSQTYREIAANDLGPNAGLQTRLVPTEDLTIAQTPVVPGNLARKRADLEARALRRAYNGAPPTIPHRVDPRDVTGCVACHGPSGMTRGDVVASPMPHQHYANCTQCHAPTRSLAKDEQRWPDNTFEGLPAPTAGHRASPGAPPVIPHSTAMRSNCTSCHGPRGAEGLQSSHPWRASCTQCHAPWAARDGHPDADSQAPLFLPQPATPADGGNRG